MKDFLPGGDEALEEGRFHDIIIDNVSDCCDVYPKYYQYRTSYFGVDFALINIRNHGKVILDRPSDLFKIWNPRDTPDGLRVVGFPGDKDRSHLPYHDKRVDPF